VRALIPWDRGDLVAMLYRDAEVLSADAEPEGTRIHARVGLRELAAIRRFADGVVGEPAARGGA
jgi:GTP-binding protein HflX